MVHHEDRPTTVRSACLAITPDPGPASVEALRKMVELALPGHRVAVVTLPGVGWPEDAPPVSRGPVRNSRGQEIPGTGPHVCLSFNCDC